MALTKIGSIGINTGIAFAGVTTIATLNGSDSVLSVGGTVNFVSDVSIGGTVSIAGTLTYEDVTNVDAVGLITARDGINVGSGITLSVDGDIFFTGIMTGNGSGLTGVANTDVIFTDKITLPDSAAGSINVGLASDLQIFHNGSQSKIIDTQGNELRLNADTIRFRDKDDSDTYANFIHDGAVELYHDNTKTFETASDGITILGAEGGNAFISFEADEGDDNSDKFDIGVYNGGPFKIQNKASGSWEDNVVINGDGSVELYHNNSKRLETDANGIHVTTNVHLPDNGVLELGTDSDILFYHDGLNGYLKNVTNNLHIGAFSTGGNSGIAFYSGNNDRAYLDPNGHFYPIDDNSYDLGTSSYRWRNLYTTDLQLSNEGKTNDVDGTWGNYTIQEGESDLFLINNRSGKKYKFNLTEVS